MPTDALPDSTAALFEARRSVGDFDPTRPLSDALLHEIVRRASLSPSANNLQPWRLIAVRSEEARQKLHAVSRKQSRILAAPVTLIVIGDHDGWKPTNPVWEELLSHPDADRVRIERSMASSASFYGASPEMQAHFGDTNAALFAMSLLYAARSLGVDSHPMGGIDHAGIAREFGLREGEKVTLLISMGYHDDAKPLRPRPRRRTYKELVEEL